MVIYHAFPAFLPGGFIGVDVFFVISGYLITKIIQGNLTRGQFSLVDFYLRRCKRILPALLTVIIFALITGWFLLYPDEYRRLAIHSTAANFFLLNFALIRELGYFDIESQFKPLLHLWTLSVEEQFYALWPVLLLTAYKLKIKAIWLVSTVIILSFCANVYFIQTYPNHVFFNSLTRVWQLGAGALLALISLKHIPCRIAPAANLLGITSTLGLVLISGSAFFIHQQYPYPGLLAVFPTIGAMMVIAGGINLPFWLGMRWLGLISYPLYLWHWVLISFYSVYIGEHPEFLPLIILIAIAVIFSMLTKKYIEVWRYSKSKRVVPALLIITVLISFLGVQIYLSNGVPSRKHLAYTQAYKFDYWRQPIVDETCTEYVKPWLSERKKFTYCRMEDSNSSDPILAIFGDSHAHAAFPGMASIADENGHDTLLIASSSCPPLLGYLWGKTPKQIQNCQESITQRLKILSQDTRIRKVAFFVRGPLYIHGEISGKHTQKSVMQSLASGNENNAGYDDYFTGLLSTLKKIENIPHIDNVYFYLENPELDFSPKQLIPRPFAQSKNNKMPTMNRQVFDQRMQAYNHRLRQTVKNISKVKIIDAAPYFCTDKSCSAIRNNTLLYFDDDHLSVAGSHFLADKSAPILFQDESK